MAQAGDADKLVRISGFTELPQIDARLSAGFYWKLPHNRLGALQRSLKGWAVSGESTESLASEETYTAGAKALSFCGYLRHD